MSASPSMVEELLSQLQGAPMQQMAQSLGASPAQTESAVSAALPMLFGALGNNAQSGQGADALFGALQRDHSTAGGLDVGGLLGSILGGAGGAGGGAQAGGLGGLLGSVMGGAGGAGGLGGLLGSVLGGGAGGGQAQASGSALDGGNILGHIFGGKQDQAAGQLGQATGLGNNAGNLLTMLAPLVMSFLAQRVLAGGMDSSQLGNALGQEKANVQQQGGIGGGILGSLLDQDGDGQVGLSDLMKIGGGLLNNRR